MDWPEAEFWLDQAERLIGRELPEEGD